MKSLLSLVLISFVFTSFSYAETGGEPEKEDPKKGDSLSTEATPVETVSFYDTAAVYTDDWNNNVTFWYPEFDYHDSTILEFTGPTNGFSFPVSQEAIERMGRGFGGYHKGVDISLDTGDPISSAFDGKVRYAKWNSGGFGYLVIVRHTNGMETYYAHLSKLKVKPNQIVKAGETIGLAGSTGRSYSPHLHFEVRYNHKAFDPSKIFDLDNFCLKQETAMVCDLVAKGSSSHKGHNHSHGKSQKSTADLSKGTVYAIKSGDSLSKIAGKYGTTVDSLCKLNGMSRSTVLQIGQKIRIK